MQRIGFVVSEGFQIVGIAAQAVFEFANRVAGEPPYEVRVLSENGGLVRSSMGIALETERFSRLAFDTLIVLGTEDSTPNSTPGLLKFGSTRSEGVQAPHVHLHGRIHPGGGGRAGRPPRNHALVLLSSVAIELSKGQGGGGSNFHRRWSDMDFGGSDRGSRSGIGDG